MYPPPHAYPPLPTPARRWWHHPALVITALVLIPPLGIALAWTGRWSKGKKIVATVLAGLWFLTPFLGDPPKKTGTEAKPQAAAAAPSSSPSPGPSPSGPPGFVGQNLRAAKSGASSAGYDSISHDASDGNAGQADEDNWKVCFQAPAAKQTGKLPTLDFAVVRNEVPCPAKNGDPIPYPKMPKVVGLTFARASGTLKPIGLRKVEPQSAYTDVSLPAAVDDWTVCFQEPAEGTEVRDPKTTTAYVKLTAPGTPCPVQQNTELHPKPTPTPDDDDSGTSSTGGSASGSGGSSTDGGSTGGGGAGTVTPGAFCSPAGAIGTGKNGSAYTCKGPTPNRWRR
ncbi:PASTA domain-containing protein [Streptomyces sp. NPDC088762]|uniref:PASTA domain-containing protein n=1 Tax=Streptomyces sp. NPDC088762 TaxID=3365891 RepID=UPI003820D80E